MKRKTLLTAALVGAVGLGVLAAGTADARGPGWGPGYGPCQQFQRTFTTPLSVKDVTKIYEGRMVMKRNPNVKLGSVTEKDDKTILVEIVTKDGSLVRQIEVDRSTGRRTPVQ